MLKATLTQIAQWAGAAEVLGATEQLFDRVETDSRKVQAGDLFVCLTGERFDAHDFLAQVAAAGAAAALVSKPNSDVDLPQIVVADTELALAQLAKNQFAQFQGRVIGLTGSAGKTTTKEMIAAILREVGNPLVTQGNLNNQIGVPLTLLSLTEQHDCAVIEMGASRKGDIAYLVDLVRPQVALVNNVEPAHIEGFGSLAGVARGKFEIFAGVRADGVCVINLDNAFTRAYPEQLSGRKLINFSLNEAADVTASELTLADGLQHFTLNINGESAPVQLAFYGRHNVGNALAAAACCSAAGIAIADIARGLSKAVPYKGRLQRRLTACGAIVIDDSYNANPASMRMAIDVLAAQPGRRLFVMGNMAELGPEALALHAEIGQYARDAGITEFLCTGELAQAAAERFGDGAQHFVDWQTLAEAASLALAPDTIFLIKGSRSAGMERVADYLVAFAR